MAVVPGPAREYTGVGLPSAARSARIGAPEVGGVEQAEILVIGAGVAGLACARALADGGVSPVVLDRARGVGGRCATRRVDGQPVDHGVVFLHGSDPALLAALEAVESPRRDGWPARVHGAGAPCQPAAFQPGQERLAFEDGVSAFPKTLARGLDVRLGRDVRHLTTDRGTVEVTTRAGETYRSRTVILALALEQAIPFLDCLGAAGDEVTAVRRLLATFATVPCLTLLAGYPRLAGEPPWDIAYPEASAIFQLVCHDSAKRPDPPTTTLVFQAQPAWSRRHLDEGPEAWAAAMLGEAARFLGPWAADPVWAQAHRWLHARLEPGNELAAPLLLDLVGGARLGLAGELFAAGGGVQAAFASGRRLAERLLSKGGY
jgi:renalase